jgi:hypothetical protein
MADSKRKWYALPVLNPNTQVIYNLYDCSKCLELENNLQHVLSELSSLQLINKLLLKELEETTIKFEAMSDGTVKGEIRCIPGLLAHDGI